MLSVILFLTFGTLALIEAGDDETMAMVGKVIYQRFRIKYLSTLYCVFDSRYCCCCCFFVLFTCVFVCSSKKWPHW